MWPRKFCEKLALGILKAISQTSYFPTQEEHASAQCAACRWRKRKDDPTHTRVRGECLHPDVEAGEVSVWQRQFPCPACRRRSMRYDPDHTYKDGVSVVGAGARFTVGAQPGGRRCAIRGSSPC